MKLRLAILCPVIAMALLVPAAVRAENAADAAEAAEPVPPTLVAKGNEPFWSLRIEGDVLVFHTPEGETRGKIEGGAVKDEETGATRRAGVLDGGRVSVTITPEVTMDSMSGMPYPARASVTMPDGSQLTGVAGDPLDLLAGGWRVAIMDGEAVAGEQPPTLDFARDGGLSGDASCNRYHGKFTLTGEGLAISPLAATRRMCGPELMASERKFLSLMAGVDGFAIGAAGELVLTAGESPSITAVRP